MADCLPFMRVLQLFGGGERLAAEAEREGAGGAVGGGEQGHASRRRRRRRGRRKSGGGRGGRGEGERARERDEPREGCAAAWYPIELRLCYATSDTEIGYAATRRGAENGGGSRRVGSAICLRVHYTIPGTGLAYGAISVLSYAWYCSSARSTRLGCCDAGREGGAASWAGSRGGGRGGRGERGGRGGRGG
eukprot:2037455-Rhodomonas_salina.1